MSFDPIIYPNWKTYLFSFVKRRARFKCENCKAKDTKENDLRVVFLDQDPKNTSKRNLALLCEICRPKIRDKYHPGQIVMFHKYIPKWLRNRENSLIKFNRNH